MCDNNNTQSIADYLAQLLKDKKQLAAFPNVFLHLERLLDDGKQSFYFDFPYFWCFDSFEIEHRGSLYTSKSNTYVDECKFCEIAYVSAMQSIHIPFRIFREK